MSLHDDFAEALLAPDLACPDGLFSSNGADPASRFVVYRNNVHSSLINALATAYPVTLQLVGDEFFRAMAGIFVQAYPPASPLISEYGSTFADFIQGFEPAASVPYLADVARLDTMVTVVDGVNFLRDFHEAESLASRGETLVEDDERSITDLLIEQVEFADVLLISKIDLISSHEREELMAILKGLNTHAEIVPMAMGAVPLEKILNTGRFDFERAAQAPGWLKELRGEHIPETEEYGIASTAYRARKPLHPERFFNFINREWTNGRLLRSKGFFWLASKYQEAGSWSQAGGLMRHGFAGRWWRFVPKAQWPTDEEGLQAIMKNWQAQSGDCRQELVFIGQNIDFAQLTAELDACLLTDAEMALGVDAWQALPDPFGPWHEEAA